MRRVLLTIFGSPARAFFVGVIRFYQVVVSPALPGRCKYYPSCSQYALDAVREYGAARGFVLGAWRVLRCNPLSYGGYDPVSRQKLFRSRHGDVREPAGERDAGVVDRIAGLGIAGHGVTTCHAGHQHLARG